MTENCEQRILHYNSVGSTNDVANELARQGAAQGVTVWADSQDNGRGRLGKQWLSPVSTGLYFSVVVRPDVATVDYPKITFVAGLSVAQGIEKVQPGLLVGLKWPNDIYFGSLKCGGILTESSGLTGSFEKRFAVVGIGLNVNTEYEHFPQELRATATSLLIESQAKTERKVLLEFIRRQLLENLRVFETKGFQPVIHAWRKRDVFLGKRLVWVTVNHSLVEGVSLGPDDEGVLHVRDDAGRRHQILSGDIRLANG